MYSVGLPKTPKRSRVLQKYKYILENIETLAKIISTEHGKTLDDAKGSVIRGLEVVEFVMEYHIY